MIDTTIKAYATRQLGCLVLALALAGGLLLFGGSQARTAGAPGGERPTGVAPSHATITGFARVVDGDTIVIGGVRIRLEGIDAPETSQTCSKRTGEAWACGRQATGELVRMIGDRPVICEDRGLDKYRRVLAVCRAGDLELNAEMVRRGYAWAFVRYSQAYVAVEAEARAAGAGIWSGEATPAWDYRAGRWQTAEPASPSGCAIKGNVTANGRIYHLPWSPWYGRVKMDGDRGKRWFCSEAEALAAGWRPAQVSN